MIHIGPWEATVGLMRGAGSRLAWWWPALSLRPLSLCRSIWPRAAICFESPARIVTRMGRNRAAGFGRRFSAIEPYPLGSPPPSTFAQDDGFQQDRHQGRAYQKLVLSAMKIAYRALNRDGKMPRRQRAPLGPQRSRARSQHPSVDAADGSAELLRRRSSRATCACA